VCRRERKRRRGGDDYDSDDSDMEDLKGYAGISTVCVCVDVCVCVRVCAGLESAVRSANKSASVMIENTHCWIHAVLVFACVCVSLQVWNLPCAPPTSLPL